MTPVKPNGVEVFASFTYTSLRRSQISLADYNPRAFDPGGRKKLKALIKKVGLVEPLVVNGRSTTNGFPPEDVYFMLVGGHQRISCMDELADFHLGPDGGPLNDYDVPVALLSVSLAREKEINIALNNTALQGNWDLGLLEDVLADPSVDLAMTGFEKSDLQLLLSDEALTGIYGQQVEAERESVEALHAIKADSIEETREQRAADRERLAADREREQQETGGRPIVPTHTIQTPNQASPDQDSQAGHLHPARPAASAASSADGSSSPDASTDARTPLQIARATPARDRTTEQWRLIREHYRSRQAEANESEFFVVFSFDSDADCTQFLQDCGFDPGMRYHSGTALIDLMNDLAGSAEGGQSGEDA